jgi:methionyl-tRNA synthetase
MTQSDEDGVPHRFYITTAIDYVNAEPHLGHAYEKLVTDCLARFHRQRGDETFFLTGADEHGQKIAREADAQGIAPQAFADRLSGRFRAAWNALDIAYDRYVRTTEPGHEIAVHEIFRRAWQRGDIYTADYEGLYCVACETFYMEKDLQEGRRCPVHGAPVQAVKERNLFFRLSAYRDRLRDHIRAHPEFILPDIRRNEVLSVVEEGLQDLSISRAAVKWGVSIPPEIEGAAGQTIWVWWDALTNYISAIGFPDERYRTWWCEPGPDGGPTDRPNAIHIIGKDISRFHCLLWPAMLMSAGLPLPKTIFVHGFITMGGEKLSKTAGRMVDPLEVTERFGVDALRYYILREVPFGRDGEFSWEQVVERYNTDLANELGNLASRAVSMLHRYRGGTVPARWTAGALEEEVRSLAQLVAVEVVEAYGGFAPSDALEATWRLVKRANRYVEETKPWVLAKDPSMAGALDTALGTLLECARLAAYWAWPAIPRKTEELWQGLGLDGSPGVPGTNAAVARWFAGGATPPLAGRALPPVRILFPKIEVPVGPGA